MYTAYFGLDHKPFKSKDPRHFYRNTVLDNTCAALLQAIRQRRGFVLLTGESGVGKTMLLRRCMAEATDIRFVLLAHASLDFPDMLSYLCANLDLPASQMSTAQQSRLVQDVLVTEAASNRVIALVLDDVQGASVEALGQLLAFSEVLPPEQRLQVMLAGLPDFEGKLRQPELQALQASIALHCCLERLPPHEVGNFIIQQLRVAGYPDEALLSAATITHIDSHCQGVPRAIAMLCDALLMFASLDPGRGITPELVDEAAQSCFLSERPRTPDAAQARKVLDSGLALGTADLDLSLDFTLEPEEQALPLANAPEPAVAAVLPPVAAPVAESISLALLPQSSTLREFATLLDEVEAKSQGASARDRAVLHYFRARYLLLLRGGDSTQIAELERRVARLLESRQPVLLDLVIARGTGAQPTGTLCALVLNPSWWQYREIRLRVEGPDLLFTDDGRFAALRLLDGRSAQPVYAEYRCPQSDLLPTTLHLRLELCNHRGEWSAYDGWVELRADFQGYTPVRVAVQHIGGELRLDYFRAEPPAEPMTGAVGAWLLGAGAAQNPDAVGGLAYTLPLELEPDKSYVDPLVAARAASQILSRGSVLSRALLLAADPTCAPARIELVSRPFMIFGRYNTGTGKGFGDFALGFTADYTRISRLHCVICALGDQLALMPTSDLGHTYTGRNGQRLERGSWHLLETGDQLDICDLYLLRLTLAWDERSQPEARDWDIHAPRDKFGHYLLELVETLRQLDQRKDMDDLRAAFRNRYLNLLCMQDRLAELSGVGNPGTLLYARFERADSAGGHSPVVHYYLPKWLSLGSAADAGLRITAPGVEAHHAELFFRDGMYWVQNLAGPGAVHIGCHRLATNEVLALEAGDQILIGEARFSFESY